MRGNKHLFEINNGYSGCIDLRRSPDNAPVRRQNEWVFMRKGRGTITSAEGRHLY